jgi:hypothetical protein
VPEGTAAFSAVSDRGGRACGWNCAHREHDKSWALYVFSSINAIRKYSMEELVRLGISWIWVGLESRQLSYAKLKDAVTRASLLSCAATESSCWDRQ